MLGLVLGSTSLVKAATIIVPGGGDLQAALNNAQCGDTVVLDANATFTAPSDGFVARTKCVASPITVSTSNLANLPSGRQVGISDALNMAKMVTPGPYPAVTFAGGSQGWKFIGIEITTTPIFDYDHYVNTLVDVGRYVSPPPADISFDRCWIHSQEDGTDSLITTAKILVDAEGVNISLLNSRIATPGPYMVTTTTFDNTAAVMMIKGPGPLTIDNSFLNAWFSCFFMGGGNLSTNNTATVLASPAPTLYSATFSNVNNLNVGDLIALADGPSQGDGGDPNLNGLYYRVAKVTGISGNSVGFIPWAGSIGSLPGCTGDCGIPLTQPPLSPGGARWNGTNPSNVTITHSTFWINPTVAGQIYAATNRAPKGFFEIKAVDGLYMEGNNFTGWPATLALTQHNQTGQNGGPSPWSVIRDVTIRSNRFNTSTPFGSQLFSLLLEDNVGTSVVGGNVLIENNLFTSGGWVGDFFSGNGVTIRHNTILNNVGWANGRLLNVNYVPINAFTFNDNVVSNNEYGLNYGAGGSISGLAMTGNVLITGTIDPYRPNCFNVYPVGNFCPTAQGELGFADAANGNYRLSLNSVFRNQASDGTDPGVNQDVLEAALAGGTTPGPSPSPTPSPSPSPSPSVSPTPTPTPTPVPSPTPTPSPTPQGWTNFALAANGGNATGSSSYDSRYPVAAAIDGDRKGRSWGNGGGWNDATSNSFPDWLEVDFAGTRTISEIDLFTLQDDYPNAAEPTDLLTFTMFGVSDFGVEYWNGTSWVSLATTTGNNKIKRSVTFSPVTTPKIRVVVNGALSSYSRIVEVETWGVAAAPTPTPTPTATISGRLIYANGTTPGKDVTLTLTGPAGFTSRTTTTDSDGNYSFASLPGGTDYTVIPSKVGDANGISAFDASLAARFAANLILLTGNQEIAADASNNGSVSAFDASQIARTAANIPNSGVAGSWKFIPSSLVFNNLTADRTNENMTAILVGDVSGNWMPSQVPAALQAAAVATTTAVALPNKRDLPGSATTIPVTVGDVTGQGIFSYFLDVTFDQTVLQPQSTPYDANGTLSNGWLITANAATPGHLILNAFNTNAMTGLGLLLHLKFNVVGAPGSQTPLTWQSFTFNEGNPADNEINGNFKAAGPTSSRTTVRQKNH